MRLVRSWLLDFLEDGPWSEENALRRTLIGLGIGIESVERIEDDLVLELEVTANRPDLLCHYGVARELKAALKIASKERPLDEMLPPGKGFPISIRTENCHRYCGLVIEGVTVGPSSDLIRSRLEKSGLRPISNIVDATNYLLLELNHPLHAFDLEKIDSEIVVRQAVAGEKIALLDGREYELRAEDMVIADRSRPVALAGIMGGSGSAVTDATRTILLEAAYFVPACVRRSARRLGLSTDSSYRFERGADWESPEHVMRRLATLVREFAGGSVRGGFVDVCTVEHKRRRIAFSPDAARRVLGYDVHAPKMKLSAIGCKVSGEEVTVPPWRPDLAGEIDLVEEIARFGGYDAIPETLPGLGRPTPDFCATLPEAAGASASGLRRFRAEVERFCLEQGLDRCSHFSFERPEYGEVVIANPINAREDRMRSTLLPALCRSAQHRLDHAGSAGVTLHEIEKTFRLERGAPAETLTLGILIGGVVTEKRYDGRLEEKASLDHVIGTVSALSRRLRLSVLLEAGTGERTAIFDAPARLVAGGAEVGRIGRVPFDRIMGAQDSAASAAMEFYGCEIDLLKLYAVTVAQSTAAKYSPLPRFPSSTRDLAFTVDPALPVGEIVAAARAAGGAHLESVAIFDIFTMKDKKSKSVAIRLVFRSPERTLADAEIAAAVDAVTAAVSSRCKATLRAQ